MVVLKAVDVERKEKNAEDSHERLMQQSQALKAQKEADVKHKTSEVTNLERSAAELRSDAASAKQQLEAVGESLGERFWDVCKKEAKSPLQAVGLATQPRGTSPSCPKSARRRPAYEC